MSDPETTPTPPNEVDLATEERLLKQEEFAARREEARLKLKATSARWWQGADPLLLAVIAGIFTLAGNMFLAAYNSHATIEQEKTKAEHALRQEEKKAKDDLELEREKAKATLILQAVSTNDSDAARRNLLFFLDGGLIKDDGGKIRAALDKYAPVLPSASGQTTRTPPTTPEAYNDAFWSANLRPEWISKLDATLDRIIAAKSKLEGPARAVHTPWYVIGVLWMLETGGNFSLHLHNGDPLTAQTVNEPKGRPQDWPPPPGVDPWEYSAADALRLHGLNDMDGLQIGEMLARLERFNGRGYQKKGLFSPYLWSGTDLYEKGKYLSDHGFSTDAVSELVGAAAVLRRLQDRKIIDLRGSASASAP